MNGTPDICEKLIIGQMALDEISISTICFFKGAYALLRDGGGVTSKQMQLASNASRARASIHIAALTRKGYLQKTSKCSREHRWCISPKVLYSPDVMSATFANIMMLRTA